MQLFAWLIQPIFETTSVRCSHFAEDCYQGMSKRWCRFVGCNKETPFRGINTQSCPAAATHRNAVERNSKPQIRTRRCFAAVRGARRDEAGRGGAAACHICDYVMVTECDKVTLVGRSAPHHHPVSPAPKLQAI